MYEAFIYYILVGSYLCWPSSFILVFVHFSLSSILVTTHSGSGASEPVGREEGSEEEPDEDPDASEPGGERGGSRGGTR